MSNICTWCDEEMLPKDATELGDQPIHKECVAEAQAVTEMDAMEMAERCIDYGEFSSAYIERWEQHREQH